MNRADLCRILEEGGGVDALHEVISSTPHVLNSVDRFGRNPLHALTTVEHANVVLAALERETALELLHAVDREGRTPEVVARQRGFDAVAALLSTESAARAPKGDPPRAADAADGDAALANVAAECTRGRAQWDNDFIPALSRHLEQAAPFLPQRAS